MLQSHRIEVLTNTGGVWKKKWRRWAFYGLQRPLERRFLGKTRTFRPNELPQGFEILQRLGTHLLSLNPKKLQILVWDFEPLFKVTSGSLGSATGVSKKRTYFIRRTKMQQDLPNGCVVSAAGGQGGSKNALRRRPVHKLERPADTHSTGPLEGRTDPATTKPN